MFNVKKKIVKDYRNIIILILLLAVFFSIGKMIFNNNTFAATFSLGQYADFVNSQSFQQDKHEAFLHKAISHVFPIGGAKEGNSPLTAMKGMYTSVVKSVFFVDLKNPYTFIKPQFPVMDLYHDVLAMELENNNGESDSEVTSSKNIDFEELKSKVDEEDETKLKQDLDDLGESGEGVYIPDTEEVLDSLNNAGSLSLENVKLPSKIKFEKNDKPQILIYHTHGTESYKPASEGNYHTLRKEFTVITIGEIITKELEKQGFNVLHDTTYHDYPSYNGSYTRSLSTAKEILKKNPSIKVILDIHRDGYDNIEVNPNRENIIRNNQTVINNETMTKFQFVIGSETPNRGEVETFAKFVKTVSDYKYTGFSKAVLVKPYGKFNQYLVDHYALLELGSNANTIEEAKKAAVYFADVFGEALKYITE